MAVTINTNVASLGVQRLLAQHTAKLASTFERLSSGLRINHASDDPAGLSIASALNVDARVYSQAIRNISDGISAISIGEGAIQQLGGIVTRIKELAEESSNGTLKLPQRTAIDKEADSLVDEYNRIVATTEFNGLKLLDGSVQNITIQAGYSSAGQGNGQLTLSLNSALQRATGDGSFAAALSSTFEAAYGAVASDFDRDGKIDYAIADGAGDIQFALGNGDGSFKVPVFFDTGGGGALNYYDLSTGDYNGDGLTDIAGSVYNATAIGIFLGNGNGTFKLATSFSTYSRGKNITTADFNNDGRADLVVAGVSASLATVLISNANGSFRAPVTLATSGINFQAAAGDVNEDGNMDIIVADPSISGGHSSSLFLGRGDGSFQTARSVSSTDNTAGVSLNDLNGDGHLDLVSTPFEDQIGISFGNGDGTFSARVQYAGDPLGNSALKVGDINGDGISDIVTNAYSASGGLSVLLGNENGSFKARVSYVAEAHSSRLNLADLNNDGAIDIISGLTETRVNLGNLQHVSTLPKLNLRRQDEARAALETAAQALTLVTSGEGALGAFQSRLDFASATLKITRENYLSGASRILDADVAEESSVLLRTQILQQAGAEILSQANLQPSLALKLLSG